MDPVTISVVLLAIVGGAGNQLGTQLWEGVVSLVRRPFRHKTTGSDADAAVVASSGEAELAAFQRAPGDRQKAMALAEALVARSGADEEFQQALKSWLQQAEPIRASEGNVMNTISGPQQGTVLMGRDFSNVTFGAPPPPPVPGSAS